MVSIFKIIRHNDIHLLKFLIDASTGDQHRTTYSNVTKKDIQWIQHYLKRSGSKYFDLNKRSSVGRTPLHCAATWNRVAIAHALIELPQVDVNLRDRENGWTALHRYFIQLDRSRSNTFLTRDFTLDLCIWAI